MSNSAEAPPSFGAPLIGYSVACFLCGCMVVQCYIYTKTDRARSDPRYLKLLIMFICLMDLFHQFVLGIYMYVTLIIHNGDPAYFGFGPWSFIAIFPLNALTSSSVQVFYAWRVYILGNHSRVLPFIICLFSSLAFAFQLVSTVRIAGLHELESFGAITSIVDTGLGSYVLTDIIIVWSQCYFLSHSRSEFAPTNELIDKLIYTIISTGLAPTMIDLAHLISFTIDGSSSFTHLAFNIIAPKLYANSFMASLNARAFILKGDGTNNCPDSNRVHQVITSRISFRTGPTPPQSPINGTFVLKATHMDSP